MPGVEGDFVYVSSEGWNIARVMQIKQEYFHSKGALINTCITLKKSTVVLLNEKRRVWKQITVIFSVQHRIDGTVQFCTQSIS